VVSSEPALSHSDELTVFLTVSSARPVPKALPVPAGTPAEVTNRLAENIARILALPDVKEKFNAGFLDAMPQGSVEMARFLDEEVRQWKAVAVQTGISLD
jgi:tripartite-type tricarboxylate transporter receptor subunit TctC